MKRIILLAVCAAFTGASMGQVSFGVQVGANIAFGKASNTVDPSYPVAIGNDPKVGVLGGFLAEIPIGTSLAFRPELNFIQKGSKSNATFAAFNNDIDVHKVTLNYLELPLNVVYKLNLGGGNLFFGLGPSLAFGISGKDKVTNDAYPSDNKTYDIKFDGKKSDDITDPNDNDRHLKRFDVGANILAGYKLPMGVFFKIGYNHNFMDIDPNKDNNDPLDRGSYKNRGFNICVGYMIGGSKKPSKN